VRAGVTFGHVTPSGNSAYCWCATASPGWLVM
jgi:hypothetical protein